MIDAALTEAKPMYQELAGIKEADLKPDERELAAAYKALEQVRLRNPRLLNNLNDLRQTLNSRLSGRAVILGALGTSSTDTVATRLPDRFRHTERAESG